MHSAWYLKDSTVVEGPFSEPEIRARLLANAFGPEAVVKQGESEWTSAEEVKELFAQIYQSGWYVKAKGETVGPFISQKVIKLHEEGRLPKDAMLRKGTSKSWREASVVVDILKSQAELSNQLSKMRRSSISKAEEPVPKESKAKQKPERTPKRNQTNRPTKKEGQALVVDAISLNEDAVVSPVRVEPIPVEPIPVEPIPVAMRAPMHSVTGAVDGGFVDTPSPFVAATHPPPPLPAGNYNQTPHRRSTSNQLDDDLVWFWFWSMVGVAIVARIVMQVFLHLSMLGAAFSGLVISGVLCWLTGMVVGIMGILIPFRESSQQGLLCLFVPFYWFFYVITRWDRCWQVTLLSAALYIWIATIVPCVGLLLLPLAAGIVGAVVGFPEHR